MYKDLCKKCAKKLKDKYELYKGISISILKICEECNKNEARLHVKKEKK